MCRSAKDAFKGVRGGGLIPHSGGCGVVDPAEARGWRKPPPPLTPDILEASRQQEIRKMVDKSPSGDNNKARCAHVDG